MNDTVAVTVAQKKMGSGLVPMLSIGYNGGAQLRELNRVAQCVVDEGETRDAAPAVATLYGTKCITPISCYLLSGPKHLLLRPVLNERG